ncbi:Lipoyltransferase 1, mitochondrial [Cryptotermes secundus]|uniref:Lipoyltransferase 1, mitochondrial n=1 Tax=Cryptotermes secundus TaxID=105785 RepID=A0A2J7QKV7_9NEOP|nr:lipoyltransferase 1, mitochondrial isoform X1 [Cryptotermes secundus]PNF29215.1 Lipoyltransferase 1, mitochondrial [Cryptotermes secundus]
MAQNFVQGSIVKLQRIAITGMKRNKPLALSSMKFCNYSSSAQQGSEEAKVAGTVKSVFISQSNDIFTNLALEDWLYRNFDFTNHHILLLWQNSPAVVIGRHQNPWLEANTAVLSEHGIEIARRNSGGGTVYHDRGNLNLTFFTPREHYSRKNNLQLICRALLREWGLKTEISPREDIVSGNYKQISGTAAKLGRPNAYHHCTLLVDVDKVKLGHALHKHNKGIKTNATQSIPSPVMNLCDLNSHVKMEKLLASIGWEYLRTDPYSAEDKGEDFIGKQRGFQFINPTDQWFPGLEKLRAEFASWGWRFGKSPKFNVTRTFRVPRELLSKDELTDQELSITIDVNKGVVEDVLLTVPPRLAAAKGFSGQAQVVTSLRGQQFSEEAITMLQKALSELESPEQTRNEFVVHCMRQVVTSI